jgi:vitamin B12/bleomycin/antimicrobial peptide transport system ATP-binding/permease protein
MARFSLLKENWTAIMRRQKRLTFFTAGYGQVQVVVPILAAGPAYFAGAIGLGGLMQTASAFGRVETALSFFVKAYPQLAEWKSVMERLDAFERCIADHETCPARTQLVCAKAHGAIKTSDLALAKPDGSSLLRLEGIELLPGKTSLLTGRSGLGKSTFLRALAGIWPHAEGQIEMPAGARVMVLPQRPYLPYGTLREAILYPHAGASNRDDEIRDLLSRIGLSQLADRLDEETNWQQRLSLGEQQRVTLVRAILFAPDWLFLDEATASLDEPGERVAYRLLSEALPQASIVSIGHRSTLKALHSRHIELADTSTAEPARQHVARAGIGRPLAA